MASASGLIEIEAPELESRHEESLQSVLSEIVGTHLGKYWVGVPEIKASNLQKALLYAAENHDYFVSYISTNHGSGVYIGPLHPDKLRTLLKTNLLATAT